MILPENQNNFPSKIMDYLASGKRIISTRFIGWERFADYITFCDDYDEMAKYMRDGVEGFSEDIYQRNREYAKTFLWEEQVRRMING